MRKLLFLLFLLFSCENRIPEKEATKFGTQEAGKSDRKVLKLALPNPVCGGTPENLPMKLKMPVKKEILIPFDISIISIGCKVTSSDSEPIIGELDYVVDGDKEGCDGSYVELGPGRQWVQIDLGVKKEIHIIVLWHNHKTGRVYYDVVVQLSNDIDFINYDIIFNNDLDNSLGLGIGTDDYYLDDFRGKLIEVMGRYRYIRCWSNGSTNSDLNHYTEVEIWGK